MNVLSSIRDWLDAPRFCPDDGKPIEVEALPHFHPRTGERRDHWFWHCPDVYVSSAADSIRWSQTGDHIHVHGIGRPRWHREQAG